MAGTIYVPNCGFGFGGSLIKSELQSSTALFLAVVLCVDKWSVMTCNRLKNLL